VYEVRAVNERSPVAIFVADTGEVLTLDDWGRTGQSHAIVLYDRSGHVVRDLDLEDVLTPEEIRDRVDHSVSSIWWRYGTESAWADQKAFHVTTVFGDELLVSLKDGTIKRGPASFARLRSYIRRERPCVRPELRVIHVVKEGRKYDAVTCALRPLGSSCHKGAVGFGYPGQQRDVQLDSIAFDRLLESSLVLLPGIRRDWAVTWGAGLVQVELAFACSHAEADEYRLVVDRCATKDPKVLGLLDELLAVTGLADRVSCPDEP
jgi:hypothetical protein